MDETLQHIVGTSISLVNRDLLGLPLSMGGLGISRATDIADITLYHLWILRVQFNRILRSAVGMNMHGLPWNILVPPLPEKITSIVSPLINQTRSSNKVLSYSRPALPVGMLF